MKKYVRWIMLTTAVIGMGFSMPSCQDQEAQHKIEALQATQAVLNKKVSTLETQVNTLNNDMGQAKQLLSQMTNVLQSQKSSIDQLTENLKNAQSKSVKASPKRRR
jgi:septal ring factor EnvC (AmiA/AmiB activator)